MHDTPGVATPDAMADGVLAVLAGSPLDQVASGLGVPTAHLADASATYRQAGHAALEAHAATRDWYQVHVHFPDWSTAEQTAATHLDPPLQHLHDASVIAGWWFIRKAPCWRLRLTPGSDVALADTKTSINTVLDRLTAAGAISRWQPTHYEPETVAFGGRPGMDIAHELFCSDSGHTLDYLRLTEPVIGRRELSVLLCTALFRAAGQDWFERGDIWHRVTRLRPAPAATPTGRLAELAESLHTILAADVRPTGALFGEHAPLAFATPWAAAFHHAGRALAAAADDGALQRGTRDILAHHVIFHWNRIGLPSTTQSVLAHAAETAIFTLGPPHTEQAALAARAKGH